MELEIRSEKRKFRKLDRMLEKVSNYLSTFITIHNTYLSPSEKSDLMIEHNAYLSFTFSKLKIKQRDLENSNIRLNEINYNKQNEIEILLNLLVNNCSLYVLRKPKEKWTKEIIVLFLLKCFSIYDFTKMRYISAHEKEIIGDIFSVNEIRLSDQINLFVNQTLKEDKYKILENQLISREVLLKWKYRHLLKEDPDLNVIELEIKDNKEA